MISGDVITYTYTATNTGNVTLTNVAVSEILLDSDASTYSGTKFSGTGTAPAPSAMALTTDNAPLSDSSDSGGNQVYNTLAVGDTVTWTATYTVTQADIDAGGVTNQAVALGTSPSGQPDAVTDLSDDTAAGDDPTEMTITPAPSLKITKTVDDSDLVDGVRPGDVLSYTITVENNGNVTLSQLVLTDTFTAMDNSPLDLTSGPTLTSTPELNTTTLAVGEVWTYAATYELSAETITKGGVENIAVMDAETPNGTPVSAESKVGGNTSDDGDGLPTDTGFPGEISGSVKSYLSGVSGVTVRLLKLVNGSYEPVLDGQVAVTMETDEAGNYVFRNIPPGIYGVEFEELADTNLSTTSATQGAETAQNRITNIAVDAGAVEIKQDAFFVDPAGVVYNSETFAPLSGATVTLYFNGNPVPNDWLNTTLGQSNGSETDANGRYFYLFNPENAESGTYTLVVQKTGYKMSKAVQPNSGSYVPELGGGIENIVENDVPEEGLTQKYYMAFDFIFGDDPPSTSNGIANNHIPLDPKLVPEVKQDVIDILKDDLTATMAQQGARMQGYAASALGRLKSRDGGSCKAELDAVLQGEQIMFTSASAKIREESGAVLDKLADILKTCEGTTLQVAGHTDSNGSDADNMLLSKARVDAVVAALDERGVDTLLLAGVGYGESSPIADNATPIGQAQNRRIEFALPKLESEAIGCVNGSKTDHDLSANAQENGSDVSGNFSREYHDCSSDSWRTVQGDLSYLHQDSGVDQAMMNLSWRQERFVTDNRVRGRFIGGYASRSTVTGTGEGTILGFGLNGGLTGADRLSNGLYFDYYLGAAAGRHTFDLDFERDLGVINATGYYSYGALFAGSALSGAMKVQNLDLTPRAGIDLAWSPGGTGSITAARGQLEDSDSLTVPEVMGLRGFLELGIEDLLATSHLNLSVTPRVLCDWGLGGVSMGCGYGGTIGLTSEANANGESFGMSLESAHTDQSSSGSISLSYEWPIGNGTLQGGVKAITSGDASVEANYAVKF